MTFPCQGVQAENLRDWLHKFLVDILLESQDHRAVLAH